MEWIQQKTCVTIRKELEGVAFTTQTFTESGPLGAGKDS